MCSDHESIEMQWTFSIVYSHTWRCPILYFTVSSGPDKTTLLSRNCVLSILKRLHYNNGQDEREDTWEFLSVEEHPVFGTPAFMLHPCRTEERLNSMLQSTSNAVINDDAGRMLAWMSMILPSVGFGIPSRTFLHLQRAVSRLDEAAVTGD
jgi:ubiquitin-like-conjugating enzyme ATG10